MANLKNMFVEKPIKTETVSNVTVEGVFACQVQGCEGEAEIARKIEDRLFWKCNECGHTSNMASFI